MMVPNNNDLTTQNICGYGQLSQQNCPIVDFLFTLRKWVLEEMLKRRNI